MERQNPHILFNVIYEDQDELLELSIDETVYDLKLEMYDIFGVPSYEQSWNCSTDPPNDKTKLRSCFSIDDINILILERKRMQFPSQTNPITNGFPCDEKALSNDTSADTGTSALSFVEYFLNNYDGCDVLLHITNLKDAIETACLGDRKDRKVLMLYLHNKTNKFSSEFCKNLNNPEMKEIMDHFFLIGWNVEDVKYHKALKDELHANNLPELCKFIDKKASTVFLIVPIGNDVTLFSCIQKYKLFDVLTSFKEAVEVLNKENQVETELEKVSSQNGDDCLGSQKFQQLMLDCLGNRDYDSFDLFEHQFLKEKIAYALYGPPQDEAGYDSKQMKRVEKLFNAILTQNNNVAKWKNRVIISFIYNCIEPLPAEKLDRVKKYKDYNHKTDTVPIPIFVLRKCKDSVNPCRIFIDDTGRVYSSWEKYLTENKLHQCHMVLPRNGRYAADGNGNVLLETHLSPACGIGPKILKGTDIASTVVGLGSGGIFLAAAIPAITVAPVALVVAGVAGIGVGAYSIGRSIFTIVDRTTHDETMSFVNSEARGAYINIVAGTLGFVGAGANVAVTQLVTKGVNISQGATATLSGINMVNVAAGGAGILNSGFDIFSQWYDENQAPSALAVLQLSCSILFFGHAVYNFKMGATVVEEAQTNALKEFQESLRSNRHKKTFNKLLKETVRRNDGNVAKGQAEVISTIRNISNKDEVFAVLTRSNKDMNKNNVKFSAEDGQIKLNGHAINMMEFAQMEKNERLSFLSELPNKLTEPTGSEVRTLATDLKSFLVGVDIQDITRLAFNLLKIFGNVDGSLKDRILDAIMAVSDYLKINEMNLWKELDHLFPNIDKYFMLAKMVVGFLQKFVDDREHAYQKWKENGSDPAEEPFFGRVSLDYSRRILEFLDEASNVYFIQTKLTSAALQLIVGYFYDWFAKQVYDKEENKERRENRSATNRDEPNKKFKCSICEGFFYAEKPPKTKT